MKDLFVIHPKNGKKKNQIIVTRRIYMSGGKEGTRTLYMEVRVGIID